MAGVFLFYQPLPIKFISISNPQRVLKPVTSMSKTARQLTAPYAIDRVPIQLRKPSISDTFRQAHRERGLDIRDNLQNPILQFIQSSLLQ